MNHITVGVLLLNNLKMIILLRAKVEISIFNFSKCIIIIYNKNYICLCLNTNAQIHISCVCIYYTKNQIVAKRLFGNEISSVNQK